LVRTQGASIGMGGRDGVRLMVDEAGQSLVEFALALPVLLLILLGLADFGRAFFYTTAIANAARAGAEYAAKNAGAGANATTIGYKVCNETGFVSYSSTATCPGLSTAVSPSPPVSGGPDITVTVTYNFELFSAYLVGRIIGTDPIALRAQATFPALR
jgi:Flp pilus assembly protein TadG